MRHLRCGFVHRDQLGNSDKFIAFGEEAIKNVRQGKLTHYRTASPGLQIALLVLLIMQITRAAGAIGIPGLYVTEDPGAKDESARHGALYLRFGLG